MQQRVSLRWEGADLQESLCSVRKGRHREAFFANFVCSMRSRVGQRRVRCARRPIHRSAQVYLHLDSRRIFVKTNRHHHVASAEREALHRIDTLDDPKNAIPITHDSRTMPS